MPNSYPTIDIKDGEDAILDASFRNNIINVNHEILDRTRNLVQLTRRHSEIKGTIVKLANAGFHMYKSSDGVSSFIKYDHIKNIWQRIRNGSFLIEHEIIYSVQMPDSGLIPSKIIVVFSSISDPIYMASLLRMFNQNYKSIGRYIPQDTLVLRIADIGSVVGSFYLNNNFMIDYETRVQRVIQSVAQRFNISPTKIVLYGASKGGTGALYHAMIGGFNVVAVDPIVDDDFYERTLRDSHFTIGTFPDRKANKFRTAANHFQSNTHVNIISSRASPQYSYISSLINETELKRFVHFVLSSHPDIKDHPDVSPKTLNVAIMLMGLAFYGMPVPRAGERNVI